MVACKCNANVKYTDLVAFDVKVMMRQVMFWYVML